MSHFFLLSLDVPVDKWNISVSYNWDTPWFYLDYFKLIKKQELHGVKLDLGKPKTIYKLIKAKDTVERVLELPSDTCKVVWRNVFSKNLTNRHKELLWMAILEGLLLTSFMHTRSLSKYRR